VFAWTYDDLKSYEETIFQHIIPFREEEILVKKTIRMMNPKLKPLVNVELEKLKKARIIYPIRHSDCISNPVIVGKKTRVLHIIFVTLMTINDVNLSFVFRRINSSNS
jgi:hypothetical protein